MNKIKRRIHALERRNVKLTLKMAKAQYKRNKKTLIEYDNGYVEHWYTYKFFKKVYKEGVKNNNIKQIHFTEDDLI